MPGYNAQYSDGQTASSVAVQAAMEEAGLTITGEGGSAIDQWAWEDVRFAEPVSPSRPIRLASRSREGARLVIDDPGALTVLKHRARYLSRDPFDRARIRTIASITGICVAIVLFFVYGLPLVAKPIAALIPVAWEEKVGDNTINIINKIFASDRPLCDNATGAAALTTMADKLRTTFKTPYTIRVDVADSPVVNALATPGGRVLIFRGLIAKANSPDEVAGVLAHEMAHVINRHPTQGMINSLGWSSLMAVFTGGASLSSEALARFAAHLATSANSRTLESEADDRAIVMLVDSGIGSAGLADFFRTLQKEEGKGLTLPAYISTHPSTEDRINVIDAKKSPATTPALSDTEWQALRNICK